MDHSAGLLLYRRTPEIEVFLGPFGAAEEKRLEWRGVESR